jgi:acetyl-CoA carboxylase carboxyltransferase component
VTSTGAEPYVLNDIVGREIDLGVEYLRGSGTTGHVHADVRSRGIDIGAYMVRLGQRTVHNATHSPIILTTYQALNTLMGTEVRTSEMVITADPATPSSQENPIQQSDQVWFPDSAHKTATAIQDFNGEDLPLFILANWRGFSGGQRGMFDEVLKFGAAIVDGLVNYEQSCSSTSRRSRSCVVAQGLWWTQPSTRAS